MTLTRTRLLMLLLAALAAAIAVAAFAVPGASSPEAEPELTLDGPEDGTLFGADSVGDATYRVTADPEEALDDAAISLNGEDVTEQAAREGRALVWSADGLDDGEYEIVARLVDEDEEGEGGASADDPEDAEDESAARLTFAIDTEPPALAIDDPDGPVIGDEDYELTGTVDDPDATVEADGEEATVDGDEFRVTIRPDASEPVTVTATDAAGNSATDEVELAWVPSRVRVDEVRSVHVSFHGWITGSKRDPVIDMIEAGLINSVELDLKDESGMVGYDTEVGLAHEAGAVGGFFDLEEEIEFLHDMGVHVSGRIVAFADPVLARHEWDNGDRDRVIQTADGDFYTGRYDGFINFANEDVRQYLVDLAVEAAEAGIDDILWDYVRRPDGPVEKFRFAGLEEGTSPEETIASFVGEADEAIEPYGVEHGGSLYGIAVDRPTQIGQDVDLLSEHFDYVSPMLYPSHWGPGEYGVANPNAQPYDIIHASLEAWLEKVEGTDTRVVPWLQDFSLGHSYGPAEVKAQIDAAADLGVDEWILWNAGMNYTPAALPGPEGSIED